MAKTTLSKKTINRIKTILPDVLERNPVLSLPAIAKQLDLTRASLWYARKANKEIAKIINKYMDAKKEIVPQLVRQTWEQRLISGKAQGAEYMFYMMNHFPDEFQDRRALVNNTNIVKVENHEDKFLKSQSEKDLNDFVRGIIERKQAQDHQVRV